MSQTLAPPRRRQKEARPQQLLDAALELFVEKGFAATRAEEVAQRAGVSKGTLYLYYASKEDLLKAVIREQLSTRIAAGAVHVERHRGSVAELLRDVLSRWWLEVFDSPTSGVFKLIVSEVRNFPDLAEFYQREVVQPGEQLISRVVQRGIDNGEFDAVDVSLVVHSLVLPMVMLCTYKHSLGACPGHDEHFDPRSFIGGHIDLVIRGLLRHGGRPPAAPRGGRGCRP
ncbi:MAG: TetR/AcrR family transcriptional regulator [Burkholderiaceae bacterium]|nr:MAG: TetR/AcrR family transcriptional regulator [Burkholderiaceae bacterium]MCC7284826.1 TetR/AcrR family transcriptional regulator [Burkholderiaceae bacterium]